MSAQRRSQGGDWQTLRRCLLSRLAVSGEALGPAPLGNGFMKGWGASLARGTNTQQRYPVGNPQFPRAELGATVPSTGFFEAGPCGPYKNFLGPLAGTA